jgi:integrase/recombinase XerC
MMLIFSSFKVVGKRNKERLVPVLPVLVEQLLLYKSERALIILLLMRTIFNQKKV